jgi:hypothetical protein
LCGKLSFSAALLQSRSHTSTRRTLSLDRRLWARRIKPSPALITPLTLLACPCLQGPKALSSDAEPSSLEPLSPQSSSPWHLQHSNISTRCPRHLSNPSRLRLRIIDRHHSAPWDLRPDLERLAFIRTSRAEALAANRTLQSRTTRRRHTACTARPIRRSP